MEIKKSNVFLMFLFSLVLFFSVIGFVFSLKNDSVTASAYDEKIQLTQPCDYTQQISSYKRGSTGTRTFFSDIWIECTSTGTFTLEIYNSAPLSFSYYCSLVDSNSSTSGSSLGSFSSSAGRMNVDTVTGKYIYIDLSSETTTKYLYSDLHIVLPGAVSPTVLSAPVLMFDGEDTISWTYPDGAENVNSVVISLPDGTSVSLSPSISTYLCTMDGDYKVYFTAKADSGYSDSPFSNTVSVVINNTPVKLSSPSISYNSDSKLLTWSAVPHATSYEVRRDSDGVVYPVSSTSFTPPSSDYYSARAIGDGESYLTSEWGNVVMVELPSEPITLATPIVSYNSTTHVLSWTNVNPATSYEVKETTSGDVVSLTTLAYTVTVSGNYCVRAIGDGVNSLSSPWSTPISIEITVDPDPPAEPVDKLLPPVLSYDATINTLSWTTPNDSSLVQFVAVVRPGGVVSLYPPKINSINPTLGGDFKVYFVAKDDSGYADSEYSNSVLVQIVDNSFNPFDTIFHAADEFLSIRLFGNEFTLGGVLGIGFGIVLLGVLVKLLMG